MSSNLSKKVLLISCLLFLCNHINAAEHLTSPATGVNMTDYFKVLFGLAFVIALFLGTTFLFKRFGNTPMNGRGQIRLVDGLYLGNRERLVLVELEGKQILLSITPGQINKIDTIDKTSVNKNANA